MGQVPLERALSKLGVLSRSQTKQLVEAGRISVDGHVVRDPLLLLVPEKARITIDGKAVSKASLCTIVLYKPRGALATRSDALQELPRDVVSILLRLHRALNVLADFVDARVFVHKVQARSRG